MCYTEIQAARLEAACTLYLHHTDFGSVIRRYVIVARP